MARYPPKSSSINDKVNRVQVVTAKFNKWPGSVRCLHEVRGGKVKRNVGNGRRYHVVSGSNLVKILDLSDRCKRYFDDFAARAFHLDTRSGQSLGGFHAFNDAANAPAINSDDLNVVFSV